MHLYDNFYNLRQQVFKQCIHTLVLNASASLLKFLFLPSFQKCLEYIITTSKVQKYPLLLNKTIKAQFNTKIVNVK